jgi:ABC-type sugar transport system ATPase subunit
MLEVQNISKIHRGIPAVDDVRFRIGLGEIVRSRHQTSKNVR